MLTDTIRDSALAIAKDATRWDLSYYTEEDRKRLRALVAELLELREEMSMFPSGDRMRELEAGKGRYDKEDVEFLIELESTL